MADQKTQVVITAKDDTAAGINAAVANIGRLGGAFTGLANPITMAVAGITAATASIAASIKGAVDTGEHLNKLSQKTGIAVESLSALAYAGELADVPLESLANGIKKLSVNMAEAASNTGSKAAEAFKALGVRVTDSSGKLRGAEEVMGDLADRFTAIEDGAGKTALAVAIFGKSGSDLIPFLNQGGAGMRELAKEAKALGLVMSGETAKASEELNDNIKKLTLSGQALGRSIAADIVPELAKLVGLMVEARKEGAGLFSSLAIGLRTGDPGATPLQDLRDRAASLQGTISFLTQGGQSPTDPVFDTKLKNSRAELAILQREIAKRLKEAEDFGPPALLEAPAMKDESEATKKQKELAARIKHFEELGARNLNEYVNKFGSDDAEIFGADAIAKANERSKKAADQEAAATEKLRQKYIELADPLQKYRLQLDEINRLRAEGRLTADQAIEAEWAVSEAMEKTKNDMLGIKEAGVDTFGALTAAVKGWGDQFTNTLADMVMSGKANFSDLANSIIRDLLRIQIQKNITDPIVKAGTGFLDNLFKGSSFGNLFGDSMPTLSGGGYTGSGARSGGLDGEGGFLAMLHPQESVIDHAKGGTVSSGVTVVQHLNFAVGVAQTVRAEVLNLMPQIQSAAQVAVMDARLRGGAARMAFKG